MSYSTSSRWIRAACLGMLGWGSAAPAQALDLENHNSLFEVLASARPTAGAVEVDLKMAGRENLVLRVEGVNQSYTGWTVSGVGVGIDWRHYCWEDRRGLVYDFGTDLIQATIQPKTGSSAKKFIPYAHAALGYRFWFDLCDCDDRGTSYVRHDPTGSTVYVAAGLNGALVTPSANGVNVPKASLMPYVVLTLGHAF